jgi:hypothetical protein
LAGRARPLGQAPEVTIAATEEQEWRAFARSKYGYTDARLLADYWGQPLGEAKARIGRKILWGERDVAVLEQFIVDSKIKALQSLDRGRSSLPLFTDYGYKYQDAEALSKFWSGSVFDAKVRIERNLILGNEAVVKKALTYARTPRS